MKLCAANLVDNIYRNNYVIGAPEHLPEQIMSGDPVFQFSDLQISSPGMKGQETTAAGSIITVGADVLNSGSTGILPVELYLDGKICEKQLFPVIGNNSRRIRFELRIYDAGKHSLAIGNTEYKHIFIEGEKPAVVFENLQLSDTSVLAGETVRLHVLAKNLLPGPAHEEVKLFLNDRESESQFVRLEAFESREIGFTIRPDTGKYTVRIMNSNAINLTVSDWTVVKTARDNLFTYCSAKAKPCHIESEPEKNTYKITAGGSDFFHAEDSYATVFMKKIKGDFVATVKIKRFGQRTHQWFRAGLFVRNDMTRSFDTQPGSRGSVLQFGTPGRAGINYDEFGNGCMHKASSQNLPEDVEFPVWLKLVRHGNSFSGYTSLDGETWINEKRTDNIPGLADSIDLGLAAGSPDKKQYVVEFADWEVKVARSKN